MFQPSFIDSHAHISQGDYSEDQSLMIQRCKQNNVLAIIDNADSLESFDFVLKTHNTYPDYVYSALGIHPEFSGNDDEYISKAINIIKSNKDSVVAIGECGLDFHYLLGTSKEREMAVFEKMAILAKELNKPLIVHSREAFDETYDILKKIKPQKIDFHCYCYGIEEIEKLSSLNLDIRFGFNGILTFKNSKELQHVFLQVPEDKLMLETDSPCLAPTPYRGKRNEPSYLKLIFSKMVELKGISDNCNKIERFSSLLIRNTKDFYGI